MTRDTSATTGPLEAELRRVQQLVGDLQRQRKELSIQVRQLTEKSHSLVQQIRPQPTSGKPNRCFWEVRRSFETLNLEKRWKRDTAYVWK